METKIKRLKKPLKLSGCLGNDNLSFRREVESLKSSGVLNITVDLRDVTGVRSDGFSTLISVALELKEAGGGLEITNASEPAREYLHSRKLPCSQIFLKWVEPGQGRQVALTLSQKAA